MLLQEYLIWHNTQKPHDLGFYWDKILGRLEAHQISLQATQDWDRAFSWESMGIPRGMDKWLADGVNFFLQLKTQQLSHKMCQNHDQGVSALLEAVEIMGQ